LALLDVPLRAAALAEGVGLMGLGPRCATLHAAMHKLSLRRGAFTLKQPVSRF
jgi:hypothetical protein